MDDPANASAADQSPVDQSVEIELEETFALLSAMAKGRFAKIPIKPLVDLILLSTQEADFPVRKAAMDALIRRQGFARRDGLQLLTKAKKGGFGSYRVGVPAKKGKGARATKSTGRSYQTEILSADPLVISCNCLDYVRNSLGICKHGLTLLHAVRPAVFSPQAKAIGSPELSCRPRLIWNPIHPMTGSSDRLLRLQLEGTSSRRFAQSKPDPNTTWPAAKRLKWIQKQIKAIEIDHFTVTPAARQVLQEEETKSKLLVSNERSFKRAWATLPQLHRTLYGYQEEGVRQFLETGRLLLGDDMGLGKTTQAIACCHALFQSQRVRLGLLIVPAALKPQWAREWKETSEIPLIRVDGSPDQRRHIYENTKRGFLLLGYEQLLRDLPQIEALAAEFVLLDEAQRIKNWATKSAATVKSLNPKYRLVLTGTPMENRFEELASLMDFVESTALEPKWRVVPWHSEQAGKGERGIVGARNLNVLRERLGTNFLRRRRAEVLSQLPERTDIRLAVELSAAQRSEHDDLRRPIASLMQRAARRPLTQAEFLRLMQLLTTQRMIVNALPLLNFEHEWARCQAESHPSEGFFEGLFAPKLSRFRDLVESYVFEQGRKMVVFSQWRKMLRLTEWSVRDLLKAQGKRALFFTGAESGKKRERAIVEFHDDPDAVILFLSDAGGVGLNLQKAANCCVNLELPWNPAVLEQRIGRIYRLGQDRPIDVINLVGEDCIESRIANLVAKKQALFSALFDGTSNEIMFEESTSFLDGVKKLIEPTESIDEALAKNDGEGDADSDEDLSESIEKAHTDALANAQGASGTQEAAPANSDERARTVKGVPSPSEGNPLLAALSAISIQSTPEGGLRIEAPPEVAAPLASLLEGFASALRRNA